MSRLLCCPQGHRWEGPGDESDGVTVGPAACPECGQPGSPAPPGGETVVYERARPSPTPAPSLPSLLAPDEAPHRAASAPACAEQQTEFGEGPAAGRASGDGPLTEAGPAPDATIAPPDVKAVERAAPGVPHVAGFEILGEVGRGGMGVVYKARHLRLDRIVALKMILAGTHAAAADLQRFHTEAEAIAQLQHPNIVEIYTVGEQAGWPFLALEYVDGGNLAQLLAGGRQPCRRAAELVERLARGIQAAHAHGIVHRDLKPANVLLTADGTPKIVDFGLAKRLDAGHGKTQTGAVLGTPSYMAPEQAGGKKDVGPAADVYALGAILYELLTGKPPFRSENSLETVLQVISAEVTPPRKLRPNLPRDLETICLKCLRKSPAERYTSAAALGDDLGRFLAGEPIRARRASAAERAVKWVRRRPGTAAVAAVALVALAVAGWLYGGDAYRLVTNRGRLVVEGGPLTLHVHVRRQGEQVAVVNLGTERAIDLPAGDYELELTGHTEGLELSAERLTVTRNGRAVIRVRPETVGELRRFDGHRGPVRALALSPDGRHALSGSGPAGGDRTLRLWDVQTGKELRQLGRPGGDVLTAAFARDGKQALSGGADGVVYLWDVQAGREIRQLRGHKGAVQGVAFAPDGRFAVSGGADKTVRLWDLAAGKELRRCEGHTGAVRSVAFSPDGQFVVSSGADQRVRLWDVATAKELGPFTGQQDGGGLCVAFSPDGRLVAAGAEDTMVWLWSAETGKLVRRLRGHTKAVTAVSFSPEGRQLLSASADRTVRVWDLATGQERKRLAGHSDGVLAVVAAPDGRHALSAGGANFEEQWVKGRDFSLRWWAVPRPRPGRAAEATASWGEALVLRGHTADVCPTVFAPNGEQILTGGWDGTVRLWDADSGALLRQFDGRTGQVLALSFAPDGEQALSGGSDTALRLWDVATGRLLKQVYQSSQVGDVAFARDGKWALTAALSERAVLLWDVPRGTIVRRFTGHTGLVQSVAWAPDGKRALSSSDDGTLRLWDVDTGQELRRFTGHTNQVWKGAFSPDGKRVLSASHDGTVRLWATDTGEELLCLAGHQGVVYAVAFTPDGRRAVSVGADRTVRVWDLARGEEQALMVGHEGEILYVAVSPDGTRAVTGSRDRTARVWRLPPPPPSPPGPETLGRVVVASDTPAALLIVKRAGRTVRALNPRSKRPAELPPGAYTVEPAGNVRGLSVSPGQFTLRAGQTQRVEVRRGREYAGEIARLESQGQRIGTLALSARGDRLLVATGDGKLRLWEVPGGREVWAVDGLPASKIVLAPDGRRALVVSGGAARVLRLEDGKEVDRLGPTARPIVAMTFLPDGGQAVLGDWGGGLHVWDVAGGAAPRRLNAHGMPVGCLDAARDGKRVLAGGRGGVVRLWDVADGKELRTFHGHRGAVSAVALSPDGRLALSAGTDGTVRLWDVPSGKERRRLLGHRGPAAGAAFTPDGRRAFLWGPGLPSVIVWEVPGGRQLYAAPGAQGAALPLAFAPDALLAARATLGGAVHLAQMPDVAPDGGPAPANTGELVIELEGLPGSVIVKQKGQAVRQVDRPGNVWPGADLVLAAGAYELEWAGAPHGAELMPARFTLEKGGQQVVGVRRGPAFVGEVRRLWTDMAHGQVAPLPGGRHVLAGGRDGALVLWDVATGRALRRFVGHTNPVWGLDVTGDGKRAVSAGQDGTVRLWDVATGKELACVKDLGKAFQGGLALTPDGQQALYGTGNRLVLLDLDTNAVVREFNVPAGQNILSVALSPDGRRALTGEQDGVTLWDVATGKGERLDAGQLQGVRALAFAPDGRQALFGGMNPLACLWDVDGKKAVFRFPPQRSGVSALAFAPDGRRVVLLGRDLAGHLWDLAAREEVYRFLSPTALSATFVADGRLLLGGPGLLSVQQLPGPGHPDGQLFIRNELGSAQVEVKGQGQTQKVFAYAGGGNVLNLKPGDYTLKLLGGMQRTKLSTEQVRVQAGRLQTVHVRQAPIPPAPPDPVRTEAARKELATLLAREADPAPDRERLRADLHAFLRKYRALPPAVEAARALGRLPSPLDRLERSQIPPALLKLAGGGDARQAPPELTAVLGEARLLHTGARCVVFSPGGEWLASAGSDDVIKIWDPDTAELRTTLRGHRLLIQSLAVSRDGKWLASGSNDRTIKLWDVAQGKEVRTLEGHTGLIRAVAFSPDGKLLASAAADGVRVWDTATGQEARPPLEPGVSAWSLAFSTDGKRLACGLTTGLVKTWETKGWADGPVLRGHTRPVHALAFSPDGKLLAAGGFERTVKLYDPATGKEVRTLPPMSTLVKGLAFSPDGERLAVALGSQKVGTRVLAGKIWLGDVEGKQVRTLPGYGSACWSVAFRPAGRLLASAHLNGRVRLWDTATGTEVLRAGGHTASVGGVAFLGQGAVLATGSSDGFVKLWDMSAGGRELRSWEAHPRGVWALAPTPDGKLLATVGGDAQVVLWDAATGKKVRAWKGHKGTVMALAISPDGQTLATGGADRVVHLWRVADGALVKSLREGTGNVVDLAFSPDGRFLACGSSDGFLRLWDPARENPVRFWPGYSQARHRLSFSPDGATVAAVMLGQLQLLETGSGATLHRLFRRHAGAFGALAIRGDGAEGAIAVAGGTILLWDPETGEERRELRFRQGASSINGLVYSPDGRYLVVSETGGLVSVLRLAPPNSRRPETK